MPPRRPSQPPDPYALANRLAVAEAKLAAVERALRALFHRVNVNRPGAPEVAVDRLLLALAEVLGGLERVTNHPPPELRPPSRGFSATLSVGEELPAVGPEGRGVQRTVRIEDPLGEREARLFVPEGSLPGAAGDHGSPPDDSDPTAPARAGVSLGGG